MASKALASAALLLSLTSFSSPWNSTNLQPTCSIYTPKLGACANLLGLGNVQQWSPPTLPCCSLSHGLLDLEAAVCVCAALNAGILGTNLNIPLSLSIILNSCGHGLPSGFECKI